VVVNHWI